MTTCLNCGHVSESAFKFCPSCGTVAAVAGESGSLVGRTLNGKYRILDQIGSGSMGKVYRAEHVSLKKRMAVKVLHRDLTLNDETIRRFQGEGIAAGKFSHPNAIQIFDFDTDEAGNWFLAMELIEGRSLKDFIVQHGPVAASVAVGIVKQILSALGEAHSRGIVHRDLKPDNVMVIGTEPRKLQVKVLDFGLSKLVDVPAGATMLTQTGRILGTPRYMAPEQWHGSDVDHRVDLYATGLVLYELLTGDAPFTGSTIQEAMLRSATDPTPSLLESHLDIRVPLGLDEIVARALEKKPEARYGSAAEMIADLESIRFDKLARRKSSSVNRSGSQVADRPVAVTVAARPRWQPLAIAAVALVAVIAIVVQLMGGASASYRFVSDKPAAERTEEEATYVGDLDKAKSHLLAGELRDALASAERALRQPCSDAEVYLTRALIYAERGDSDLALLDLGDALKRDANYAEAVAETGWIHVDRQEWDEALQKFDQALALAAEQPSASVGKAVVASSRGSPAAARLLLTKVDEASLPARVQVRLGSARLQVDEVDAAIAAFQLAKRKSSRDWRAYAGLGEAYLRQSDRDKARLELEEAVRLNPNAVSAIESLATLLVAAEDWTGARRAIDQGLEVQSTNGRLQILDGVVLMNTGEADKAIQALERGTARRPKDVQAWLLLGILHQQAGRHAEAIDCYRQVHELDEELATAHLNEGLCLFALERYDEAAKKLTRAIELENSNTFALLSYGILAMDYLGRDEDALAAFLRYKRNGGEDPRVDAWIKRLGG